MARVRKSAPQVVHRLLAEQFKIVKANEPRARTGSVKGLHDLRVALRRIRTLARVFAPLDPKFMTRLDHRARKVCSRMGDARDLDVWLALFGELEEAGGLDEMARRDRKSVRAELRAARTRLAAEALDCGAFRRVKKMLTERLRRKPAADRDAPSAEALAARRMLDVRATIARRYRQAGSFSSKPAHNLRRAGRRMRYLSEFFAESLGRESVRAGEWITKAQAALGKVHDSDNALELSKDLPAGSARTRVRRHLRTRRRVFLARFRTAWKHYADPRLQQAWEKQLKATAELDAG